MKINAICGGIYSSGIAGLSFLKKHSNILQKKNTQIHVQSSLGNRFRTVAAL